MKRIRRKTDNTVAPKAKATEMSALAFDTESLQDEITKLQNQVTANMITMKDYMVSYDVKQIPAEFGNFDYTIPPGRGSTEIHIEELAAALSQEEFLSCVTASVTKVRDVMSAKELAKISTKHPGKPGDPKVAYKPKKK